MLTRIKKILGLTSYVSERDQFLKEFYKKTPFTLSQQKEFSQAKKVACQRDHAQPEEPSVKNKINEFLG